MTPVMRLGGGFSGDNGAAGWLGRKSTRAGGLPWGTSFGRRKPVSRWFRSLWRKVTGGTVTQWFSWRQRTAQWCQAMRGQGTKDGTLPCTVSGLGLIACGRTLGVARPDLTGPRNFLTRVRLSTTGCAQTARRHACAPPCADGAPGSPPHAHRPLPATGKTAPIRVLERREPQKIPSARLVRSHRWSTSLP